MKKFIYAGLFIGGYLGSYLSDKLDIGSFSVSGIIISTLISILGAVTGYKIAKYFGK